jgi:hypothetical protein
VELVLVVLRGTLSAKRKQHFHGQTLRDSRAEIERTGVRLSTGKGSKTAPLWGAVVFCGVAFPIQAFSLSQKQSPAVAAAGLCLE